MLMTSVIGIVIVIAGIIIVRRERIRLIKKLHVLQENSY